MATSFFDPSDFDQDPGFGGMREVLAARRRNPYGIDPRGDFVDPDSANAEPTVKSPAIGKESYTPAPQASYGGEQRTVARNDLMDPSQPASGSAGITAGTLKGGRDASDTMDPDPGSAIPKPNPIDAMKAVL